MLKTSYFEPFLEEKSRLLYKEVKMSSIQDEFQIKNNLLQQKIVFLYGASAPNAPM